MWTVILVALLVFLLCFAAMALKGVINARPEWFILGAIVVLSTIVLLSAWGILSWRV